MKAVAVALAAAAALIGTGCGTVLPAVQGRTDALAKQIAGDQGVAAIEAFRRAEGASVGMIDARGYAPRTAYFDSLGQPLTNGVVLIETLERRTTVSAPLFASPAPAAPAPSPVVVPVALPPAPPGTNGTMAVGDLWFGAPQP